jgi:hypothetical protein
MKGRVDQSMGIVTLIAEALPAEWVDSTGIAYLTTLENAPFPSCVLSENIVSPPMFLFELGPS